MYKMKFGAAALVIGTMVLMSSSATYAASEQDVTITNGARAIPATVVIPDGDGPFPVVVMNHGHGGGRQENGGFGGIAEALAEKGILSVRMDFPGSGDSTEPFTEGYLSNMISDSNASLDYVLANYPADADRLGILGYSMGGRIALTIGETSANPYKAMALLAPSANPGEELALYLAGSPEEYDRLYAEASGPQGYAEYHTPWGQVQQLSKTWFDELKSSSPLAAVGNYQGAILVISGNNDETVTPAISHSVGDAYPSATILDIPEADHGYGFYSDQPDVTAAVEGAISDFFAEALK